MIRKSLAMLALFAAALTIFVWHGYQSDIRAARARVSSGSQIVNTACGLIEYADVGQGPVVFAIHGAGGGFDQSLDLARAFLPPGVSNSSSVAIWLPADAFAGRRLAGGSG